MIQICFCGIRASCFCEAAEWAFEGQAVFKTPYFGGSYRTRQLGNVKTSTVLGQQGTVVMSHFVVVSPEFPAESQTHFGRILLPSNSKQCLL